MTFLRWAAPAAAALLVHGAPMGAAAQEAAGDPAAATMPADEGPSAAVMLDAIDVEAAPPSPVAPATAVIGREALERAPMRSIGEVFADVPGVEAADDRRNPGMTVEIRGLQDRGRVTTTIDGARQNFQQAGHGTAQLTYVDTNLIREITVDKAVTAAIGGAGALAGSVGFRTLDPDDVIPPGDAWGAQGKIGAGDNAMRLDAMAAVAIRPTERFAALLALSRKELGDYQIGQAGTVKASASSLVPADAPVALTGSDAVSALAKAVVGLTPSADLTLSYLDYRAQFETGSGDAVDLQDTSNRTATARLDWAPANSNHDVTATLYWNGVENHQDREARAAYSGFALDYGLDTFGGSAVDAMQLDTRAGALTLSFGAEGFSDATTTVSIAQDPTDDPDDAWFGGANPSGDRQVGGLFASGSLAPLDWLRLRAGLRADGYQLSGTASVATATTGSYADMKVDQSDWALLPSAGISILPGRGWEVFADYTEGWRPPTLSESVFGGSHIGFNLFFAPNPNLRPESSRMVELGVGWQGMGLIVPEDGLRLRASVYHRDVDDYIASATVQGRPAGGTRQSFIAYVNVDGATNFQGVELEAAYSIGRFDFGLALEATDADVDGTYDSNPWNRRADPEAITSSPTAAPPFQASFTAQARMLDDRLRAGLRLRYAADSHDALSSYELDAFATVDLWATLAITETVQARAAISNLTDQAYVDPRGSTAYPAPGRTMTLSLEARF